MSRLTQQPWFGPKRVGWGWTPITWQGWVGTLVWGIVLCLAAARGQSWPVLVGLIVAFVLFCYLTGGPPGSKLNL